MLTFLFNKFFSIKFITDGNKRMQAKQLEIIQRMKTQKKLLCVASRYFLLL